MKKLLLAVAFGVLTGCATPTTGIIPTNGGMHSVTHQGNGAWVTTDSLKTAAILEAAEFCKREGKSVNVIYTKEIQAGLGRIGVWPESNVLFKCE